MADHLFLTVLNMSFTATFVILAVILARLLLKKAPKIYSHALWSVVLFRLICPFSPESPASLLPVNTRPISSNILFEELPRLSSGSAFIDSSINPLLPPAEITNSVNPMQILVYFGRIIWLAGIAVLLIYNLLLFLRLNNQLKKRCYKGDNLYIVPCLAAPFVMGILRPRIFLPSGLSPQEQEFILLHERIHIRRFDYILKPAAFVATCIHWFNPFVWLAFFLFVKDMEMSCDEAVLKKMGSQIKKEYSSSLLSFSAGKKLAALTPLAFGESHAKSRIKNILGYRKPAFWAAVLLFAGVVLFSLSLALNPKPEKPSDYFTAALYNVSEVLYVTPLSSAIPTAENAPRYNISADYMLYSREQEDTDWTLLGSLSPASLSPKELNSLFTQPSARVLDALDRVKLIYRVEADQAQGMGYLVMQLENGEILLARYYQNEPSAAYVQWLYTLTNLSGNLSGAALYEYRTPYIGSNSAVGNILNLLPLPLGIDYDGFELATSEFPFTVTVHLKPSSQTADDFSFYTVNELPFKQNACILFSLVENADCVVFSFDTGDSQAYSLRYTSQWAQEVIGCKLWESSRSLGEFEELLLQIAYQLQ